MLELISFTSIACCKSCINLCFYGWVYNISINTLIENRLLQLTNFIVPFYTPVQRISRLSDNKFLYQLDSFLEEISLMNL